MSTTAIANGYTPATAIEKLAELNVKNSALIQSGAVYTDATLDAMFVAGSKVVTLPNWIEPRHRSTPQAESTAPTTNGLTSGYQRAARLIRTNNIGYTALSRALSLLDPQGAINAMLSGMSLADRQLTLIAILDGVLGKASSAFAALRNPHFSETSNSDTDKILDADMFLDTTALLGQRQGTLEGRAVFIAHSTILNSLKKQDKTDFDRISVGGLVLPTFKGIPVIPCDSLSRAGTTSGTVFTSYLLGEASVAMHYKTQTENYLDTAALYISEDKNKKEAVIRDDTDGVIHPMGARWIGDTIDGAVAGVTPTDAELATVTNWASGLSDVKNANMLAIVTNG